MALDPEGYSTAQRTPPAMGGQVVVPDVELDRLSRSLYIGGAGTVNCVMADGETLDFPDVPAGSTLPISVSKVLSSGTAATNIRAIW